MMDKKIGPTRNKSMGEHDGLRLRQISNCRHQRLISGYVCDFIEGF